MPRLITALVALIATLALGTASAQAGQVRLHSHDNAYSGVGHCFEATWSVEKGRCTATEEHSVEQHGIGRGAVMHVDWCDPARVEGHCFYFFNHHPIGENKLPAGYSRWMIFDNGAHRWMLAAVRMPNGPFSIVDGNWNGHSLKDSDPTLGVESHHGPLFLYVGYHGVKERQQGSTYYGYVFGFRGYLNW